MKATVTNNRIRNYREKNIYRGFNVFVESNATKIADDWFTENEIYNLDFKCKAWNKLKNAVNKLNIAAIRTVVGFNCDVTYSVYAGCSMCPCSPGFRVRKCTDDTAQQFFNHDVWMNIEVDASKIIESLPKYTEMLKKEIELEDQLATA